ncbi:MAG: GPR endopeptidase [Bacilli bacterium]|nr:GPR endopeptidase [Bacilli bacterium]
MHEINLTNFSLRTDLLIDDYKDIDSKDYNIKKINKDIYVEDINIKEENNIYKKKKGLYKTITFKDITDKDNFNLVLKTFIEELKDMIKLNDIKEEDKCLIVGLGNIESTPDALGPKTLKNILVTRHLFQLGEVEEGYRNVSILEPGVTGTTGIETKDIVLAIIKETNPNFLIIIDALATSSIDRLNKTIQITNSGITPGSGVNNSRISISKETLGIPVIVIGIPTIIDSSVIVTNTIKYMIEKFSYDKENINNKKNKLKYKIDYRDYKKELTKEDKKYLLGIIGTLSEEELMKLVVEVLNPIDYNYMVTPKEIDFLIDKMSLLLGKGINYSLNKKYNNNL